MTSDPFSNVYRDWPCTRKLLTDVGGEKATVKSVSVFLSHYFGIYHWKNSLEMMQQTSANTDYTLYNVGCGQALFTEFFMDRSDIKNGFLVDESKFHEKFIKKHLEKFKKLSFHHCQIQDFVAGQKKLKNSSIVISSEVIEHVDCPSTHLQQLSKLKNNGFICLSTPCGSWLFLLLPIYFLFSLFSKNRKKKFEEVKLMVFPLRRWKEALPLHPTILPRDLANLCRKNNLTILKHHTTLFPFCYNKYALLILIFILNFFSNSTTKDISLRILKLEEILSKLPVLKWFGARQFLILK